MCLEPIPESFGIEDSQFEQRFISNCGAAYFDINKKREFNNYNDQLFHCMYCKPGYRPIFNNDIIAKCEKIEHCDFNKPQLWFNSCSDCK